jgi:penicillin amidase
VFGLAGIGCTLNSSFPLLKRFLLGIGIPAAVALVGVYFYFKGGLPENDFSLSLPGMKMPARIHRNDVGVPTIEAKTDSDVFFAMGYLHAQDRLWQLELQRRMGQGRLSEILGGGVLRQDIWIRTLNLVGAAKSSWASLDPAAQATLTAYANGINSWRSTHSRLPAEFAMLGVDPEPWTPIDTLVWIKIFSLNMSGNFNDEVTQYLAKQFLSQRELMTFFKGVEAEQSPLQAAGDISAKDFLKLSRLQTSFKEELGMGARFVGSNAWVVSGRLTKDGSAILANDPHLSMQIPSLWYPVIQNGSALKSRGMSLVGTPLVIFGQNQAIAWGGTSMMADVQDIYLEDVSTTDPKKYRVNGQWENFTTRTEVIKVRADFPDFLRRPLEPIQIEVRNSRHGPIISDVINGPGRVMALRWTGLNEEDRTYESLLRLNYANDWSSFNEALSLYVSPALNMLYADQKGNIGYLGIGKIPVRAAGEGDVPVLGSTDQFAWTGYIPASELPQIYNPASGYIVSANNDMAGPGYHHFITNNWAPPDRANRIAELLEQSKAAGNISTEAMGKIQLDVVSMPARRMVKLLKEMSVDTQRQRRAQQLLMNWQGEMSEDSQAATIFNAWVRHLRRRLFDIRLKTDWNRRNQEQYIAGLSERVALDALYSAVHDKNSAWCQQDKKSSLPDCRTVVLQSFDGALDELEKLQGADMRQWTWGSAHSLHYDHVPFGKAGLLGKLVNRRVATGGTPDTVNVANLDFRMGEGYVQTFGPGFRQIIQLGPQRADHFYMNSTGSSGDVFSKHYSDMVEPFHSGQLYRLDQPIAPPRAAPGLPEASAAKQGG